MTKSQIDIMPEESIYSGGFPDNYEKSKMIDFHNADWEENFIFQISLKMNVINILLIC